MYDINKHPGGYAGEHAIAANAVIEAGGLYGPAADGYLNSPGTATHIVGRACSDANNTGGADGDMKVTLERGVFALSNVNSTETLTLGHIGKPVFAVSPDTVASSGTTHAGTLIGFDNEGNPLVDTTQAASNKAH